MHLRKFARATVLLAFGCSAISTGLRADDELPAIHTLRCETTCANSTPATGVSQPRLTWPDELDQSLDTYIEGYVYLNYKINTDGHVSDISVVSLVGPKAFADKAVSGVKDWIYKPATLDGKPVATCRILFVTFRKNKLTTPGARREIVRAYENAVQNAKDGKWDEAQSRLKEALSEPKLNLYERGMLANISSLVALKKADYVDAHRLSVEALSFSSPDLPNDVRQNLLETRVRSALMVGDLVDALDATDGLKAAKDFNSSSPIVKYVDDIRAKVDGMPLFTISEKIPEAGEGESTYFGLYRRNFAFQDIKGSLSGFTLNCKQQAIESKITESAEWHVPKSWSDCRILVRGAPGTTFKLAELTE